MNQQKNVNSKLKIYLKSNQASRLVIQGGVSTYAGGCSKYGMGGSCCCGGASQ